MPQDPSELNKKPPEAKPQEVNNNYNKLKTKFADRTFQLVSQNIGVVGKHTSKITSRATVQPAQLTNGKNIT